MLLYRLENKKGEGPFYGGGSATGGGILIPHSPPNEMIDDLRREFGYDDEQVNALVRTYKDKVGKWIFAWISKGHYDDFILDKENERKWNEEGYSLSVYSVDVDGEYIVFPDGQVMFDRRRARRMV